MLLDEDPAIAVVLERSDELVEHIGMVREGHFGRRESLHFGQGLRAEEGREEVPPGLDVEPEVLDGSRGRDRVAPGATEPLDAVAIPRIARDQPEVLEDIVQAHRVQAVEQRARVVEHHAGLLALGDKLGDELPHPLVAPMEDLRIVVVAHIRVVHHVLEVADDRGSRKLLIRVGNQRLVHVQRDGAGALDSRPVYGAFATTMGGLRHSVGDHRLRAAQVGQALNICG